MTSITKRNINDGNTLFILTMMLIPITIICIVYKVGIQAATLIMATFFVAAIMQRLYSPPKNGS